MKHNAAAAALEYVPPGEVVGVGTGSTVNHFIDLLAGIRERIKGAVSSSEGSTARLKERGIAVLDMNSVDYIPVYVDGADESNRRLQLIKGGGGALTREKIIAACSETFLCIADETKLVDVLGKFPLPVEIIPMARRFLSRRLAALGGRPLRRENFLTDNGNEILDVHDLRIEDPVGMETEINGWPGVVTVGLFCRRPADVLILGTPDGVRKMKAE